MPTGRFAPSPTGPLHIGNLRTGLLAWLFARSAGSDYLLRFEDLDMALVGEEHYQSQTGDLAALGLHWDGEPVRQSERFDLYLDAINLFTDRGLTYPCYCSRKDIREASQAPNGPPGASQSDDSGPARSGPASSHYPGTCRSLTSDQRRERQEAGRPPAIRVRAEAIQLSFVDLLCGEQSDVVDDFVIQRNDGTPAYNLAVMVDDSLQGIQQVVRADDLLSSTVRQLFVADALDLNTPTFAHVPLVLAPTGKRLAKRDGAVTLEDRQQLGETPAQVLSMLAASLGLAEPGEAASLDQILERFSPDLLPREPFTLDEDYLTGH